MRKAWLFICAFGLSPAAYAQDLSFSDAVAQASVEGPTIEAGEARVEAAQRERRAAGRLPDPQLVLAYDNVPITGPDRLRLGRDEMTMSRIGIMQEMPSGAERGAQRAVAEARIARADAGLEVAQLEARLGAANAWIRLYYAERRVAVLARLTREARASAEAARARLAAGVTGVDDALAAEVEAARVEDRAEEARAAVVSARADLRRWIGEAADEPLAETAPTFAIDPAFLREHLRHHPELAAFGAERAAAEAELRSARAGRWPDWSWEVSYGRRAPELEDMASVEVRVGLPVFGRQAPVIASGRANVDRVAAERAAAEREHLAMIETSLAEYEAASTNLTRARDTRLPRARQRADAAVAAYGAGSSTIAALILARGQALQAEMDVLDLEERVASLGAALTLQYAGAQP